VFAQFYQTHIAAQAQLPECVSDVILVSSVSFNCGEIIRVPLFATVKDWDNN
jgi:hypothetical protein